MKLTDNQILDGFRSFNTSITKEYFYGYCRRAYNVLDAKYHLRYKVGLDFMSLAHDYYMQLLAHDFKPLADRPESMKLSAYMFKGFWFVVMDALKAHKHEFDSKSTTDVDDVLKYVRSSDHEEGLMQQVAEAVTSHYGDRKMSELAYMFFVLGYKQKEIGEQLGMTPSAVNQRYKKMMDEVVTPFVIENYGSGIFVGKMSTPAPMGAVVHEVPVAFKTFDDMACESMPSIDNNLSVMDNRTTPDFISSLKPNEIFVFGSNLHGIHAGGAARMAHLHFGAEMGNGIGLQGQSYAIPTMQGGVDTIKPYVDDFIAFAASHPELNFLVTPIGCGIAGFEPSDIAPLFKAAIPVDNISLPSDFWDYLL